MSNRVNWPVMVTVNEDSYRGEPWKDCDSDLCAWPRCSCKQPTIFRPAIDDKDTEEK